MPEIEINEKIIRFSGSVNTNKNLELGDEILIRVKGSVVKVEDGDNQDGTKDRTFKVRVMLINEE